MPETALVISPPAGTAPTVPVGRPVTETEARIIVGPWRAVTNETVVPAAAAAGNEEPGWLPADAYEARLARLAAENAAQTDAPWQPDTPEYAAGRREISEGLLDAQLEVLTRDED